MRSAIHFILAALLWLVFVYYWQIVMQRPMNPDTKTALIALGVLLFLSVVYVTVWIFHNVRIHRRFERRKNRPEETRKPVQDYLGRWIVVDHPERLLDANYIEVDVKSTVLQGRTVEEKIFRTSRTSPRDV